MKKIYFILVCLLCSASSFSQTIFLTDTAFTTDVGYNGAAASCLYTGGGWLGLPMNAPHYSLADVITVPSGATWSFDTVILYGYEIGSSDVSTFTAGYLQIYADGPPGLGGTPIWGDTVTNILVGTGFTGIYRVDAQDLTTNQRPIMYLKLHLSPAAHLDAGTYWLRWSAKSSDNAAVYSPPKVLPGRINPSGQNGRKDSLGTWFTIDDEGHGDGFSKIIIGSAAVTSAVPELSGPSATLDQNIPNPFNGSTNISFSIKQAGYVRLTVYNMVGQVVSVLVNKYESEGAHQVIFNAGNLQPGIYFYQLDANGYTKSMSMLMN